MALPPNPQALVYYTDYIPPANEDLGDCAFCKDNLRIPVKSRLNHLIDFSSIDVIRKVKQAANLFSVARLKAHNGLHPLHESCYWQFIQDCELMFDPNDPDVLLDRPILFHPKCPTCDLPAALPEDIISNYYRHYPEPSCLSKAVKKVKKVALGCLNAGIDKTISIAGNAKKVAKVAVVAIPLLGVAGYILKSIPLRGFRLGMTTGTLTSVAAVILSRSSRRELISVETLKLFAKPFLAGILLDKSIEIITGTVNSILPSRYFLSGFAAATGVMAFAASKIPRQLPPPITEEA